MKKIVINSVKFDYNIGCRLLKLKYENCPFEELKEFWNEIKPSTFAEISALPNLEQRRVGILCLGIERLVETIKPKLVDKKTINKKTTWINENGVLENINFKDTYSLYVVKGEMLKLSFDAHFVKCKDTSTNREYLIWVNYRSIQNNNHKHSWYNEKKPTAIEAIAWTIQTDIQIGGIEKIVRQGDCIMIKKKKHFTIGDVRHLTGEEYLELLKAES